MVGIVGYGAYIPKYRIKVESIAHQWGTNAESYKRGLFVEEKSVPAPDQDTISMSVESTYRAIQRANIEPLKIGAVYVGSESHPYAVKPSGTTLAEAIGATPEVHCADFEFACKAGTEAMFVSLQHIKSGEMDYALGVGADTSQGAPGDALEYTASAGAASFIMGKNNVLASCEATYSYMSDTPDFWRREYQYYPQHGGRFTGEPAYFKHVYGCGMNLLEKTKLKPENFAFAVFHQPNGKFPLKVGEMLGFKKEQLKQGLLCPRIGNTYSGSSPLGLTAILDVAKSGDLIFMVSYGSGAGSDGFIWRVTEHLEGVQNVTLKTWDLINGDKVYLDYGQYIKFRKKIIKNV
jgi:hydroxymethylglutaryl-CoA synthase